MLGETCLLIHGQKSHGKFNILALSWDLQVLCAVMFPC